MKFNKWTLGLAAVGAVSMASAVRADEAKMSAVQTALSNTTISGYVSASANYEITPNVTPSPASSIPFQGNKQNGFNLDVVKISIAKPQDESPWASGYQVDLLFGPDAVGWNNSPGAANSDIAIKQAYVALRTPVGNGIDWKIGVFDTVIGYESSDAGNNPNYTRSWGWAIEPTEHTGILATYKINNEFTVSAGVANTLTAGINARNNYPNDGTPNRAWSKTFMGSVAFTAPSNWGWCAGDQLYAGVVYGFSNGNGGSSTGTYAGGNQYNLYAGATLNTPWKALTAGLAFDYVQNLGGGASAAPLPGHINAWTAAVYASFKATDKLSFNARGEYIESSIDDSIQKSSENAISLTGTIEYDLWANVISRLEVRYDHVLAPESSGFYDTSVIESGDAFGAPFDRTSIGLYANIIYKF
jgi:hypothetical protein